MEDKKQTDIISYKVSYKKYIWSEKKVDNGFTNMLRANEHANFLKKMGYVDVHVSENRIKKSELFSNLFIYFVIFVYILILYAIMFAIVIFGTFFINRLYELFFK